MKPFFIENIPNTKVKKSRLHGYGLFSTKEIKKGSLLCSLTGQIVEEDVYKKFYVNLFALKCEASSELQPMLNI